MSSHTRVRNPFSKIPFLAAHQDASANALAGTPGKKAHRYPAIALGLAAVTLAVGPLTATAATSSGPAAKPAAAAPAAAGTATKKAETPKPAPAVAKPQAAKTETAKPAAKPQAPKPAAKPAPKPAAKPETKAANPYTGVSMSDVSPTSAQGYQQTFTASAEQWSNATAIVKASETMGLSPYHATVAVATALQESTLRNLHYGDRDSLGLFQQRPSMGWGTAAQLTDPTYAAKAFLKELPRNLDGQSLSIAAQNVQRSFDGSLYARWQNQASSMVLSIMHQQ